MIDFSFDAAIKSVFPDIHVGLFSGQVSNTAHNGDLWQEIAQLSNEIRSTHTLESIRLIEPIHEGKKAYKMLGKDPNRYRISAEALMRRLVKGQTLYQIHTLVDSLNFISLKTSVTIGGFDLEQVTGPISLGVGQENEEFSAIGRGELNISNLPVYRDAIGAIGSPTSDCIRTMMQKETVMFLMIITSFFGPGMIHSTISELKQVLSSYASGTKFEDVIHY